MPGEVLMARDVTLHLDEFSGRALERFKRRGNGSFAAAVRTASLYYLADRDAGRPAWKVPDFAIDREAGRTVTMTLDDDTWEALEAEAHDQGVPVDVLVIHAMMYFLADVDSGRVPLKLHEALDRFDT
jgi:hypothetical protein